MEEWEVRSMENFSMKNRMSQTFLIVLTGILSTFMTLAGWHVEEVVAEKNEYSFATTQGVVQTADGRSM